MTTAALVGVNNVNFPQAIGNGFSKFVDFHGRASRSEFWFWALFAWIASGGLWASTSQGEFMTTIFSIISAVLFLPSLAVAVRRLHDTGKSALYLLMNLIPVAGPFIFLAAMLKQSTPGENQYGANPLGVYSADYYQSRQYLPSMGQTAQLPAPSTFPGYGFNFEAAHGEPVPVQARQTDEWSQQFNKLQQQARRDVPDVYRKHYFTESELHALRAGLSQAVLLDDGSGDLYLAEVTWDGSKFIENRLGI